MRLIGIDPGVNTGVARYESGVLTELLTIEPHTIERMLTQYRPARVVFEDSRLQSHTWTRAKTSAATAKMARNVGQIDQLSLREFNAVRDATDQALRDRHHAANKGRAGQ